MVAEKRVIRLISAFGQVTTPPQMAGTGSLRGTWLSQAHHGSIGRHPSRLRLAATRASVYVHFTDAQRQRRSNAIRALLLNSVSENTFNIFSGGLRLSTEADCCYLARIINGPPDVTPVSKAAVDHGPSLSVIFLIN